MRTRLISLALIVVLGVASFACDGLAGLGLWPTPTPTATPTPTRTPTPTATPTPTITPTPIPPPCDSRATPLAVGETYGGYIDTNVGYRTWFCFYVPPGTGSLSVELRDFDVDLDVYLGYGSFESVLSERPIDYTWYSNDFGTGDEFVFVPNPQAGLWYAVVASYNVISSSFTLEVTTD